MLRRLRQSGISLAAKCQLLFGAAVILIISAALWVPWQRMDQLTAQLNIKAAQAVIDYKLAEHVADEQGQRFVGRSRPSSQPLPSERLTMGGEGLLPPRLVGVAAPRGSGISRFESAALSRFLRDPDRSSEQRLFELPDGRQGYRYAQPVYARGDCLACHATPASETASTAPASPELFLAATRRAASLASATQTAMPRLIGLVSVEIPSRIDPRQLLLNRVFLLSAGALAGTLAIAIFWLITTRLILQPVRVLQETAEKVARGDLNIRSDINTGDEFQQLSETFNVMLVNLKKNADQLRAVNKSLDLKLGQLAESNVTLNESNRLKSEFLANVSHELRTPLNSILGFADLLRDQLPVAAEGKASRYVQNIVSSGNNLLDLINDLLDLAKIEAGKMEVRAEPLSLNDLFEGLTNLLKPLLEPRKLSIGCRIGTDVPIIRTDAAKLQQILYNLLSNAIKFSPPDESIQLTAELVDGRRVKISVADRGPGIDPRLHGVIFEKFRQLDGSVTRQHSGTGLGLAISKELSLLLGGTIGLQSTLGEGANFSIELPLKIESSAQDVRR